MKTQDWINEHKIEAVQDRKDEKDYWKTDNLYTEADLIELMEAFVLYRVSQRSELLRSYNKFVNEECLLAGGILSDYEIEKFEERHFG